MDKITSQIIGQATRKICSRCFYDESVSSIEFDDQGVCNYCKQVDDLTLHYGTGQRKGISTFEKILNDIKSSGRNNLYDCVIGVSGGTDSSYLVHLAKKEWGLRPLAVHYDNTWNSAIATMNIETVLRYSNVRLETHVVNNHEADDIFKAFFLAGVAELEASTDLAYAYIMRKTAAKYGIKFVLEGHSFREEGITPLGRNYFDGMYIKDIHSKFGTRPIPTYPLMTFNRFLYVSLIRQIKFIRPFWYLNYNKELAKETLAHNYGWRDYGGHHLENRMTAYFHSFYAPQKFNTDFRLNTISAKVRNGYISRETAERNYREPRFGEKGLVEYFKTRLEISDTLYEETMLKQPRSWTEFKTYKHRFEKLEPLFRVLADKELVPRAFYLKYCKQKVQSL